MYSAVGKARMLNPYQRKAEWDLAVKNLQLVCEMAVARNLKIALEPLNRFESDLVNTAKDVLRMVNDINHPAACIMLDSFHMSIEERDVESALYHPGINLSIYRYQKITEVHRAQGKLPGMITEEDLNK
jgi:D-psicose/D-tagatose/L-ribulose 3-epimerase